VEVLPDCSLPGHPEVFVVGDMIALNKLPGVAEVAMQSGVHAANTIRRRLRGGGAAPVQVPRPGVDGHSGEVPGDRQLQGGEVVGLPGVVDVARRAPDLPQGL
jgi:NADH dehydrogenase